MNRSDFQQLATARPRDAEVLLNNGCYDGAYYLLGYAVECALKACIAKLTKQYDFPDKDIVNRSYTHKLDVLLNVSGLLPEFDKESKANPSFAINWAIIKDWNESTRYESGKTESSVRQYHLAVTEEGSGVFTWLQKLWCKNHFQVK
jgi:hypothetical protein